MKARSSSVFTAVRARLRGAPDLPPGSGGLPWVGQFWSFVNNLHDFVLSGKARLGETFWARVYLRNTIFVSSAEANEWVFRGEHDYLRKNWPRSWKLLAGEHAQTVVTDRERHGRQMSVMRRILTPTDAMLPIFSRIVREHLRGWATRERVDPAVDIKLLALQIDCAALLDLDLDDRQCRWILDNFRELVKGFSCFLPLDVPGCPFAKAMGARRRLQRFFEEVIREQQAPDRASRWPRAGAGDSHPLAQLLASAREDADIPLAELKDQFQILIFAGHEFPGAGMIGMCLELIRNPAVLQRLRAEVLGAAQGPPALATLQALPFLDAFVKEVLRVYPPVPGGYREVLRDMEFGGFRFPGGWFVKFEPFLCHFDPRYWREPDRFDPERFLPPRSEDRNNPMAYVPFGGGRRACPGGRYGVLLMKMFAVELVRAYDLEFVGTPSLESKYGHLYQPQFQFGLRPASGVSGAAGSSGSSA